MDENKINLLYDHYKESVLNQKENCKLRDRLFLYLLILLGVLFLEFYDSNSTFNLAKNLIENKIKFIINYQYFSIFLMFLLLVLGLRYFQICITIERNYEYIHNLEKKLNFFYKALIDKEGVSYLKNYPIFSNFMDTIYKLFFPIVFFVVILIRFFQECKTYFYVDHIYIIYLLVPTFTLITAIVIYIFSIWKQAWIYEILKK